MAPRGEDRVPLSPIHEGRFGRLIRRVPRALGRTDEKLRPFALACEPRTDENAIVSMQQMVSLLLHNQRTGQAYAVTQPILFGHLLRTQEVECRSTM